MEVIPTMVNVEGVVMETGEDTVKCLSAVKITTSITTRDEQTVDPDDRAITYSDLSGKFRISDQVTYPNTLTFNFEKKGYTFSKLSIDIQYTFNHTSTKMVEDGNETNICVVITPLLDAIAR